MHKKLETIKQITQQMKHGSVHNSLLEWLPDMQFDLMRGSEAKGGAGGVGKRGRWLAIQLI